MENTINLIEININLTKENIEKFLETYLLQNDFRIDITRNNEEAIHYNGSNAKMFGTHFWDLYVEENKIYLISYVLYKKKKFSYDHKLFTTDVNSIDYKRFDLTDQKNTSAYAIETFISYINNNNLNIGIQERVLTTEECISMFANKEKFVPKINGNKKEFQKKETLFDDKVIHNFFKFVTFVMPIISIGDPRKAFFTIFSLIFLIDDFKKNKKIFSRIISAWGILGNSFTLLFYLLSFLV